jgi:hypothetical protein
MVRRQTAPDATGPGPRFGAYFRVRLIVEAPNLEAILEHLRHRPEGQDVCVWRDDVAVAVVRPDGTLVEIP